MHHVKLN